MDDEQVKIARERASFLIDVGDFKRALSELTNILAARPADAEAHCETAVCFSRLGDDDKALQHCKQALSIAPDWEHAHYINAFVLYRSGRNRLACESIDKAIEIEPEWPEYWALKSDIKLVSSRSRHDASTALTCAERGLEFDPEDIHCHYARASALKALNRKAEAKAEMEICLQLAPNDARFHKFQGSMMMDGRNFRGAQDSFREALRLNPESESARAGLISTLRAKNGLYRFMLRFMNPGGFAKSGTIIVIIVTIYGIDLLAKLHSAAVNALLDIFIGPFFLCLVLFAGLIFTADDIFNFLLLCDKETRSQLTASERQCSIMTCSIVFVAAFMVVYAVAWHDVVWNFWAALTAISVFTAKLVYDCEPGKARAFMYWYFGVDVVCTISFIAMISFADVLKIPRELPDSIQFVLIIVPFALALFLPMLALYFFTGKSQFENIIQIIKSRK